MSRELRLLTLLVSFVFVSVVLSGFLSSVASQKDGALRRAERGEVTLSQVSEVNITCCCFLLPWRLTLE